MSETSRVPSGWVSVRVDRVGSVRLGRQRSPDKHTGRYPTKYVRAANITRQGLDLTNLLEMDFTPVERAIFTLKVGDVLLTEASGTATQVGRAALWRGEIENCCYQNTVIRFRSHVTLPEYAVVVFRHCGASGVFARAARGVGIQHLGVSRFAALPFPLPPLDEQRRIVPVAERRLSEIREANERLRSALTHLSEQVREILAAAASGELGEQRVTGAGRKKTVATEPSEASSRSPRSKPSQPNLFDPVGPQTSSDARSEAPLPPGWKWARVDEVGEVTIGRQRSPQHQHGAHLRPYLRVANVFEDRIDTSDILTMNFEPEEAATYALKFGDILLNEGQSPELVGRSAMYRDEVPGACFQNTLIRFRAGPSVNPAYALLIFRHYMHAGVFRRVARWSTNIAHLGLDRFRALPFPLPSLEEQTRVAGEAGRRLNATAAQMDAVKDSLGRLPEMEQELLAAAVAGELVPQDPADETAAALLERLGQPPQETFSTQTAENGATLVSTKQKPQKRRLGPTPDLAAVLREAGHPLLLPELFGQAGYDRDQPEHVELFYLALRSQLGRTIQKTGDAVENATLEIIDAA